jgi:hypothetical protein
MSLQVEELRRRLREDFPPNRFDGPVSHDRCDETIALQAELSGKPWDQVPLSFVDANAISLPLLTTEATVAFLPAWLSRSLEGFYRPSEVLELTIYFLCPDEERLGQNLLASRMAIFSDRQRHFVCDFLGAVLDNTSLAVYHSDVSKARVVWCATVK